MRAVQTKAGKTGADGDAAAEGVPVVASHALTLSGDKIHYRYFHDIDLQSTLSSSLIVGASEVWLSDGDTSLSLILFDVPAVALPLPLPLPLRVLGLDLGWVLSCRISSPSSRALLSTKSLLCSVILCPHCFSSAVSTFSSAASSGDSVINGGI